MLAGIRGAVVALENTEDAILNATEELLHCLISRNALVESEVGGVFFTSTVDLNKAFPAKALRHIGWRQVPALCAQELDVPGSMKRVIRIMMFVNREKTVRVHHQYLGEAAALRPDRTGDLP